MLGQACPSTYGDLSLLTKISLSSDQGVTVSITSISGPILHHHPGHYGLRPTGKKHCVHVSSPKKNVVGRSEFCFVFYLGMYCHFFLSHLKLKRSSGKPQKCLGRGKKRGTDGIGLSKNPNVSNLKDPWP